MLNDTYIDLQLRDITSIREAYISGYRHGFDDGGGNGDGGSFGVSSIEEDESFCQYCYGDVSDDENTSCPICNDTPFHIDCLPEHRAEVH